MVAKSKTPFSDRPSDHALQLISAVTPGICSVLLTGVFGAGTSVNPPLEVNDLLLDFLHRVAHDKPVPRRKGYDGVGCLFDPFDEIAIHHDGLPVEAC
jgi:hypothetical protein